MHGLATFILLWSATLTLWGKTTQLVTLSPSPCHVDSDPEYDGIRVNCQHQGISSLPLPAHWLPPHNVTSLLLDANVITELNIDSFASLIHNSRSLLVLGLSFNRISSISPNVFSQFVSLQRLGLNNNLLNLDRQSLDGQVFNGLGNLMHISLAENANSQRTGAYNESLFSELVAMETVSLDTFTGNLSLGSLFGNNVKLDALELAGGVNSITNRSFEGFISSQLTQLRIKNAQTLYNIETGAFKNLGSLTWLEFRDSSIDVKNVLESLAPYANHNMSHLIFAGLSYSYKQSDKFLRNSVLTRQLARYLSTVCVEHFHLSSASVFIVETGVFTNSVWKRCLKSIILTNNPLEGEINELVRINSLHHLEYIRISGRKYVWANRPSPYLWKPAACVAKIKNDVSPVRSSLSHPYGTMDEISHARSSLSHPYGTPAQGKMRQVFETQLPNTVEIKTSMFSRNGDESQTHRVRIPRLIVIESSFAVPNGLHNEQNDSIDVKHDTIYLSVPPGLRVIILNCNTYNFGKIKSDVYFIGGDHLQEVHVADNGIQNFGLSWYGLQTVKVLDISRNDGSVMSPKMFDTLSTIVHLNMAGMKLDVNFMADNSKRLFHKLSNLNTLDLSDNGLLHLTRDTFATSAKLCVLNLQGNRFESIPVDMTNVPILSHLDMRGNSLKFLSNAELASLDNHFEQTGLLSLSLQGNEFDCGCESLRFLSWLQRTKISLDNAKSYTCVLATGQRTTTGEIDDLEVIWRNCQGQNAFWITLTLVCFMMLGYLCCFMIPKLKTQLKVIILKAFWVPFVMKTPIDYPIGVYIGYADQDTTLACRSLRPFIEDRLHLSTYVRHRDLLPASDMAESIMEAIHSSWRVLLVVSQHFLEDPWSYYVLKASTYAVQSDNPGRIVLAFVDANDRVMSKLPDCVLRAVREENIVTMTASGRISYEDKQAFKTAILYNT